jgi:hypothetical protein
VEVISLLTQTHKLCENKLHAQVEKEQPR